MELNTKNKFNVLAILIVLILCITAGYLIYYKSIFIEQSHLFQDPKEHVVLTREFHVGGCGLLESEFFRIYPNGTKDGDPFRVPGGRLLVITDVDWWLADFREPFSPGYATYFELALEHRIDNYISTYRVFKDTLKDDPQNRLGRSVSMTAGFVVAPDTRICPFAQVAPTNDRDILRLDVILRGYLIDGVSRKVGSPLQ